MTTLLLPNGVRYPLVGGTRECHFIGIHLKPPKTPENAARTRQSGAPRNDGVIIFHERNCPAKVYSEPAGLEAVQSSGDAHWL